MKTTSESATDSQISHTIILNDVTPNRATVVRVIAGDCPPGFYGFYARMSHALVREIGLPEVGERVWVPTTFASRGEIAITALSSGLRYPRRYCDAAIVIAEEEES